MAAQTASVLSYAFAESELGLRYIDIIKELDDPDFSPSPPCSPPSSPSNDVVCKPRHPPLPPGPPPRMSRDKAYARANEELKYRCTRCTNPVFQQTGRCSFQWSILPSFCETSSMSNSVSVRDICARDVLERVHTCTKCLLIRASACRCLRATDGG